MKKTTKYEKRLLDIALLIEKRSVYVAAAVRNYVNGDYVHAMWYQMIAYTTLQDQFELDRKLKHEERYPLFDLDKWREWR